MAAAQTGARTIRPKIHKALPEFLREFPPLPALAPWAGAIARKPHNMPSGAADLDWDATINEALQRCALPGVEPGSFYFGGGEVLRGRKGRNNAVLRSWGWGGWVPVLPGEKVGVGAVVKACAIPPQVPTVPPPALRRGAAVPEVHWIKPGAAAAMEALQGPDGFLTPKRCVPRRPMCTHTRIIACSACAAAAAARHGGASPPTPQGRVATMLQCPNAPSPLASPPPPRSTPALQAQALH